MIYATGALIHSTFQQIWKASPNCRRISNLYRKPNQTPFGIRDPTFQLPTPSANNEQALNKNSRPRMSLQQVIAADALSVHQKALEHPTHSSRDYCVNCCAALTTTKSINNPRYYYPPIKYFPWYTFTREKTVKVLIPPSDTATDFFLKLYLAFRQMLKDDGIDQFSKKKYIRACINYISTAELDGECTRKKPCRLPRILIRKFANMVVKSQIRVQNNQLNAVNPRDFLRKSSKSFYQSNSKHAPSSVAQEWHIGAPAPKISANYAVNLPN